MNSAVGERQTNVAGLTPRQWGLVVIGVITAVFLILQWQDGRFLIFPEAWDLRLREPVDLFGRWASRARNSHWLFTLFFTPLSRFLEGSVALVEAFLLALPWLVGITAVFLLALWLADVRLALLTSGALLFVGLLGLWEESMVTLALMAVCVLVALLIGVPLGIVAARRSRFEKILRPLLDGMQTMPAFVYLLPVVLFFRGFVVPGMVATIIYAVPPAIRFTTLGIKEVDVETVEAARAFGSTPRQLLSKVQLPLAMPTIIAGVNQTIMFALSIVVISSMIGVEGLGAVVLTSLRRIQVGSALEAGLAILVLALLLDRLSQAASQRRQIEQAGWRPMWWQAAGLLGGLWLLSWLLGWTAFPAGWQLNISAPIDTLVTWLRDNVYAAEIGRFSVGTGPLSDFIVIQMLDRLDALLRDWLGWPALVGLVVLAGVSLGGWRLGAASGLLLLIVGLLGMWELAMVTLAQVLVAVFLALLLGLPLGVWAAQSKRGRRTAVLRPILDFLQTIPAFVYLVPVIMLFNIGRVPGIIASVLYALPPVVRLTELGIRQANGDAVEAARAFGSTERQTLFKVQLPLALPSILAGINQTTMMVLAMVVIAGMVGGAGLGLEAVNGLARNQLGQGIEAGLAIVILAIVIDRLLQAWAQRQEVLD